MPEVKGVRLAAISSGIKEANCLDLFIAELDIGCTIGGVLTQSLLPSASVKLCRQHLKGGKARALVVNSGNANAFTGSIGDGAVISISKELANSFCSQPSEIFVASTGIIGEPLPTNLILNSLQPLIKELSAHRWYDAALSIMTTDTFAKGATQKTKIGETPIIINGIAKGSGMIAPNMATMLAFLFTDANLPASLLQAMIKQATEKSFNSITVDSDSSTNDTVLIFATGSASNSSVTDLQDPTLKNFQNALDKVCLDLAHQIIRDGEGATKFIAVKVIGANSKASAKKIGFSVANSPLVKTAIAGQDPNWGRIVMAVGKAGEKINLNQFSISFGDIEVARNGNRVIEFDEMLLSKHLQRQDVEITIDVGVGSETATVWTCDLTHDYITINADYRS